MNQEAARHKKKKPHQWKEAKGFQYPNKDSPGMTIMQEQHRQQQSSLGGIFCRKS